MCAVLGWLTCEEGIFSCLASTKEGCSQAPKARGVKLPDERGVELPEDRGVVLPRKDGERSFCIKKDSG